MAVGFGLDSNTSSVQLSSARLILLNSHNCHPRVVLSALNLMAKMGQVGSGGCTAAAGMLPNALNTYLSGPGLEEHHVPLDVLKQTLVQWALGELGLRLSMDIPKDVEESLHLLMIPVLEALNLCALDLQAQEVVCLITKQDLIETQAILMKRSKSKVTHWLGQTPIWDCQGASSGVQLLDATTVSARGASVRPLVKSRLCLSKGHWVCKIRVHNSGHGHACVGLVDATDDVLGHKSSASYFMLSSSGVLRMRTATPIGDRVSTRRVCLPSETQDKEHTIKVHLDLQAGNCGFSMNGKYFATVFRNLPKFLTPAVVLPKGSRAEFLYIDSRP